MDSQNSFLSSSDFENLDLSSFNFTMNSTANESPVYSQPTANNHDSNQFELNISIIVGISFSITIVVGIVGNLLVLLTILLQKQMRNTTNILILNLAIADLGLILLCVPFTGLNYVLSVWYFGDLWCRIVQYTSNVAAYVSILLLVLMSVDRYLAICKSFKANIYRTQKNAIMAVSILWIFILLANVPHLFLWTNHKYQHSDTENRTVCILKYNVIVSERDLYYNSSMSSVVDDAELKIRIYYSIFFICAYVLPFISIFILYGLIMLKLKDAKGQQVSKGKRRVTLMVIAVVSSFVLCWGPLQVMLFLQHVVKINFTEVHIIILVISNSIGYLNSCLNPIIYGFSNKDFRAAYAAILRCEYHHTKYKAVATQANRSEFTQTTTTRSNLAAIKLKRHDNSICTSTSMMVAKCDIHNPSLVTTNLTDKSVRDSLASGSMTTLKSPTITAKIIETKSLLNKVNAEMIDESEDI